MILCFPDRQICRHFQESFDCSGGSDIISFLCHVHDLGVLRVPIKLWYFYTTHAHGNTYRETIGEVNMEYMPMCELKYKT